MRTVLLVLVALLVLAAMWVILFAGAVDDAHPRAKPVAAVTSPPVLPEPPSTTTSSTVATVPATSPVARSAPTARRTLRSSGYCETGHMANGQPAHDGAVSSKILPRGSRWRVLTGRFAGRVFTVEDIGSLAIFDIAMPGRCADAIAYGAPMIDIEAVA